MEEIMKNAGERRPPLSDVRHMSLAPTHLTSRTKRREYEKEDSLSDSKEISRSMPELSVEEKEEEPPTRKRLESNFLEIMKEVIFEYCSIFLGP